jgi:hypothetical protein
MFNDDIFCVGAMYSGEYDACDVTLSVNPHRASLKNMPGHGGNRTYKLNDVDLFCCCYSVNISQNDQNLTIRKDHSHSRKIFTGRKFAENIIVKS